MSWGGKPHLKARAKLEPLKINGYGLWSLPASWKTCTQALRLRAAVAEQCEWHGSEGSRTPDDTGGWSRPGPRGTEKLEAGDRHHQICSENSSPAVVWEMTREGGKSGCGKSRQQAKERC